MGIWTDSLSYPSLSPGQRLTFTGAAVPGGRPSLGPVGAKAKDRNRVQTPRWALTLQRTRVRTENTQPQNVRLPFYSKLVHKC